MTMRAFSEKEFQAFLAGEVDRLRLGWLALSGHVLTEKERTDLEQAIEASLRGLPVLMIPTAGEGLGPCEFPCGHLRCHEMLQTAASPCIKCGQKIGFNNPYLPLLKGFQHEQCSQDAA